MWSLGVITYILLGGYPPFIEQNQRELFRKIKQGQYEFHPEYWGSISPEAKDLIARLLTVNPDRRITATDALRSSWMLGGDSQLEGFDLNNNLQQFRKFNAKRKLRQAVLTVSVFSGTHPFLNFYSCILADKIPQSFDVKNSLLQPIKCLPWDINSEATFALKTYIFQSEFAL